MMARRLARYNSAELRMQAKKVLREQDMDEFGVAFMPTPEEIREACKRIQENWSEGERAKRAGTNRSAGAAIRTTCSGELTAESTRRAGRDAT